MTRFWRWLTTSRYTRHLEDENRELKRRVADLENVLIPRLALMQAQSAPAKSEPAKPKDAQPVRRFTLCQECGKGAVENGKCHECDTVQKSQVINKGRRGWPTIRRELENQNSTRTQ